jgi:predicted CXXCH cytochrome family protein
MRRKAPTLLVWFSAAVLLLLPGAVLSLNPNHECDFCHSLHNAPGTRLTNDTDSEVLCLGCHGPAGPSSLKADVHSNDNNSSYPVFSFSCVDCHAVHSGYDNHLGTHFHTETGGDVTGPNIKLVGRRLDASGVAKIQTPNSGIRDVVFEFRGSNAGEPEEHSFADDDRDGNGLYDGVCETCHTQTKHHRNNATGGHKHNTGKTCTECHDHINNFNK